MTFLHSFASRRSKQTGPFSKQTSRRLRSVARRSVARRSGALRSVALCLSLSLCATLAGSLSPTAAFAQPSASDKASAEALFTAGRAALDAGEYAAACEKFEASQQIDPGVGTLLYLGACYEKLGRTASAWASFREASSVARAAGQGDRADVARERAKKLEPQLFRLTVHVAKENDIEGFGLQHGPRTLSRATFGVATPVDPGSHELTASAPGYQSWSTLVSVPNGPGSQSLSVPALVKLDTPPPGPIVAPAPGAAAPTGPAPAAGPAPDSTNDDTGSGQRTAALVLGGLGVVGLGVGTALALVAMNKDSDADDLCDDSTCFDDEGIELSQDARAAGNGATVGYLVGGAALVGALVLYLTAPSGAATAGANSVTKDSGLKLNGGVGPEGGNVWLGGQF